MDESKSRETKEKKSRVPQRSRVEQEKRVAEYRASGLTQEGYAAQAGINVGTLRGWIYNNKQRRSTSGGGKYFAPVRLSGARPGAVTLRWPQGIELEIAMNIDKAEVASLVRELLAPCLR